MDNPRLHARKKVLPSELVISNTPSQFQDNARQIAAQIQRSRKRLGNRRSRKEAQAEGCAAFSIVGFFLAFGIFAGFFLLHHQHRKVIAHIIRNPWAHAGAIFRAKGRAQGFHHHFYTGSPRFVTVVSEFIAIGDVRHEVESVFIVESI